MLDSFYISIILAGFGGGAVRNLVGFAKQFSFTKPSFDIKYFAILDWVEMEHMKLKKIASRDNASDSLTKSTGRLKFHSHIDFLMGKHSLDVCRRVMNSQ